MFPRLLHLACLASFVAASGCSKDSKAPSGERPRSSSSPLCLSEIMYHPVLEDDFVDNHEFIEIHNPSAEPLSLAGYRLAGAVRFAFGEDVTLEPAGYLVVAKNRAALLGVTEYGLDAARVLGDYEGELSNAGETVSLEAPDGLVESVTYDDALPWPLAADELGAQADWLAPELLPLDEHRHRGVSLERVSCSHPAEAPSTWSPSEVDGATPGRESSLMRSEPLPIVLALTATPSAPASDDAVTLRATFSGEGALAGVTLEYFVDDLEETGEPTSELVMQDEGGRAFSTRVPAQEAGAIVRYRVRADRGSGSDIISPRPSDPSAWHAYAVGSGVETESRLYELYVTPSRWTELWDNIEGGRVQGCDVSETWDREVPGVFVYDGQVFDVQLRYQGSTFNRTNGAQMRGFSGAAPARPSPLQAMSWHIRFPRYARFDGQRAIGLNKLTQGCPGITAGVGFELFRRAGLPAPGTRFARVHINGGYYHYMQEIQIINDELLEAYHASQGGTTAEPLGHLFKSSGTIGDDGPYGWGDGRLLEPSCGHSSAERYAYTYERKTHEWLGHDEIVALIEGLHEARAEGDAALREFLAAHFDVPRTLTYLAVINWLAAWDDMFQNHFLYQKRSDGRWFFLPWDLDRTAGGYMDGNSSFFIGEEGDESNREGWWNYFKDSFLRTYRSEYVARLKELDASVLAPTTVKRLVDDVVAQIDEEEAHGAPAGLECDVSGEAEQYRDFADVRHAAVLEL